MKKPTNSWKIVAGLALAASLAWADTASATLTVSTNNENNAAAFTPTWPVATGAANLISGLLPTDSFGNFTQESAGGTSKLTDGAIGPVTTSTAIFATCGNNGGRMAIYDLPATAANGYNITNISTFTGWGNGGRHAQAYTLYYSTKANPRKWILLGNVVYSGGFTGNNPNQPSANRVMWTDSAGAPIANNVAAIMFDFNTPTSPNGYNGYCGYSEITVEGTASATVVTQVVTIAKSNVNGANPFNPGWALETPSLIAGMSPTTTNGNFSLEPQGGLRDVSSLTAGGDLTITLWATPPTTTSPNYVTCGGGSGSGSTIIYTLTNSPINGSDVTNIVVYNGWADGGRHGQYYTVSYSTVAAPSTFIPISTVFYLPTVPGNTPSANRVAISATNGVPLASAVANVKFDFASPPAAGAFNNGFQGYAQIIVQGSDTTAPPPPPSPFLVQDTLPNYAETVVGDQVVFTAAYSNVPPATLQWQRVSGGVTNDISGATSGTLTLSNVQVSDSGSYRLKAVNATNVLAAPSYSTSAALAVGATPAAVNNVIVKYASQNFPSSTNFFPAWPVDTNSLSLIAGFTSGSGEGTFVGVGDFTGGGNFCNADAAVLSDGLPGSMTSLPNLAFTGCGTLIDGATGQSMTYQLITNGSPFGITITNITVFGGWQDAGRDQQKYQVLYSTVEAPALFAPLLTVSYNPSNPGNKQSVSRTTLVPVGGALAQNVAALRFNWNLSPRPENGWEGYSEILVGGTPSLGFVPALTNDVSPLTASDVVGGQIILTAGFSGATSLQWKKNGSDVPGATSSTLTLNNLQLADAGAYSLVASNVAGFNTTTICTVSVSPAPAATNNIVTAIATQTSDDSVFTPTWDAAALASSLISGASPSSSGDGDFTGGTFNSTATSGSLPSVLTDGTYGTIDFNLTGLHSWVTCIGSGTGVNNAQGGNYVTYTLPVSANGYDITNIMTAGGWNDGGRDQQSYTVSYATAANPTLFISLTVVSYNPTNPIGYSMNRATITPASGVLASNVVALQFDMTTPAGENGFSGYSEIAAYGSPSATSATAGAVITVEHQQDATTWTAETPNLIAGRLPTSQGPGVFTSEGCNVVNMTDGVLGFGSAFGASCGADTNASVSFVTFNANGGWDLSNIVVYTLWHDYGREGQFYNVSYSTLSAPSTFLPLASVNYNPPMAHDGRDSGLRVAITPQIGQTLLANNVAVVKFDFTPQGTQDFSWSGYTEIVLQGTQLASPVAPVFSPVTVSGGNLILTGTGGTPISSYTLLTTTNLTEPVIWTTSTTGALDGAGAFSNAVPVSAITPARFFRVQIP